MKLDYDCIRDVLISLEEITSFTPNFQFSAIRFYDLIDNLESHKCNYSIQDVFYSIVKMNEAEYINACWASPQCKDRGDLHFFFIYDITIKGHEYLNSVRNAKIWAKIKSGAAALTLSIVPEIAKAYILSHLNF